METQSALAVPVPNEWGDGDGVDLVCSMQNPMQVQQGVAQVLGVKQHTITVKQHHAGGAFGGLVGLGGGAVMVPL